MYEHIIFLLDSFKSKGVVVKEDESNDSVDFSEYKIDSFKEIKDPVKWQNDLRKELESDSNFLKDDYLIKDENNFNDLLQLIDKTMNAYDKIIIKKVLQL